MSDRILLIGVDENSCAALEAALKLAEYQVDSAYDSGAALAILNKQTYQAAVLDGDMPDALALCKDLAIAVPQLPVVVVAEDASVQRISLAFQAGAHDFLCKPLSNRQLIVRVTRAASHGDLCAELRRIQSREYSAETTPLLVGESRMMSDLRKLIRRLAPSDSSVLIEGETGSGKELVARALHGGSSRAERPFIAINCAAIPEGLLESELFGHVRGAFTDAKHERRGLFVEADGGTLFLDEVGEMPLPMQVKLLRALQDRHVRPVGGQHEVPIDVRLIAATHRALDVEVERGTFRQDLYYRLNVVRLEVPALRDRSTDKLELATYFLRRAAARSRRAPMRLSIHAAEALMAYGFPGNVRELENCMERAAAVGRYEEVILDDLPETVSAALKELPSDDDILTVEDVQRREVERVMKLVGGNKSQAAHLLQVDRRTIERKLWRVDGRISRRRRAAIKASPPSAAPSTEARTAAKKDQPN